jgi:hypothetical protein
MTKESASWLVIRVIGLAMLGYCVMLLVDIASQLLVLQKLYTIEGSLAAKAEQNIVSAWVRTGFTSVQLMVAALLSFYFLRRGRTVHRWLMREAS